MRMVVKIALGILLASLVLLAGCAVLFGAFVTEVDKGVQEEGQTSAITRADAAKVRGMSFSKTNCHCSSASPPSTP